MCRVCLWCTLFKNGGDFKRGWFTVRTFWVPKITFNWLCVCMCLSSLCNHLTSSYVLKSEEKCNFTFACNINRRVCDFWLLYLEAKNKQTFTWQDWHSLNFSCMIEVWQMLHLTVSTYGLFNSFWHLLCHSWHLNAWMPVSLRDR